jgi:hypothetical protein
MPDFLLRLALPLRLLKFCKTEIYVHRNALKLAFDVKFAPQRYSALKTITLRLVLSEIHFDLAKTWSRLQVSWSK